MKAKLALAFLFFIALTNLFSQAPNWQWAKRAVASGNLGNEGFSVATDFNGNVFVTGWFQAPVINFGTVVLTNSSAGHSDIYLTKYDVNGNVLWAKSAGGSMNDRANSVTTDLFGNVFIAGCFFSPTAIFGNDTLIDNSADDDVFLAKYDANGNLLWVRQAGSSNDDRALCVATDGNGNVAISGRFNSPSITFGSTVLTNNNGLYDLFVVKYDANGNVLWADGFGGSNNDTGYGITSGAGNFYVTGEFDSPTIAFGSTTLTTAGFGDIFLTAFDVNGNVLWTKNTGGTRLECANAVAVDAVGSLYVSGCFNSATITFGSSTLVNSDNSGMTSDICFFKYDNNGNPIWAKSAGTNGSEAGHSAAVDPKSNVYFTGALANFPITFDALVLTMPTGSADPMFVVSYDSSGVLLCGQALSSGGDDNSAVSTIAAGDAVIAGDYLTNPFLIGNDTLPLTSSEDVFVARFNCNGTDAVTTISANEKQIVIYPNPSNGKFVLENEFNGDELILEIYNSLGQKIHSQKITDHKTEIDLSNSGNGIYFVQVKTATGIYNRKIIVQQ